MTRFFLLMPILFLTAGCPVLQRQDTPVNESTFTEPKTGTSCYLYVPSYYSADRDWPLLVALHGTYGFDNPQRQAQQWKMLAEQHGFIVVAPSLRSVQGIVPVIKDVWMSDLDKDEKTILATIDEVSRQYRVDPGSIALNGFSAGGYPMYYTGLRNPARFQVLIADACNSSQDIFDRIPITDDIRKLPIVIFWGQDDLPPIKNFGWAAFRYLREHKCLKAAHKEVKGGHLRRPDVTYDIWRKYLAPRHRM